MLTTIKDLEEIVDLDSPEDSLDSLQGFVMDPKLISERVKDPEDQKFFQSEIVSITSLDTSGASKKTPRKSPRKKLKTPEKAKEVADTSDVRKLVESGLEMIQSETETETTFDASEDGHTVKSVVTKVEKTKKVAEDDIKDSDRETSLSSIILVEDSEDEFSKPKDVVIDTQGAEEVDSIASAVVGETDSEMLASSVGTASDIHESSVEHREYVFVPGSDVSMDTSEGTITHSAGKRRDDVVDSTIESTSDLDLQETIGEEKSSSGKDTPMSFDSDDGANTRRSLRKKKNKKLSSSPVKGKKSPVKSPSPMKTFTSSPKPDKAQSGGDVIDLTASDIELNPVNKTSKGSDSPGNKKVDDETLGDEEANISQATGSDTDLFMEVTVRYNSPRKSPKDKKKKKGTDQEKTPTSKVTELHDAENSDDEEVFFKSMKSKRSSMSAIEEKFIGKAIRGQKTPSKAQAKSVDSVVLDKGKGEQNTETSRTKSTEEIISVVEDIKSKLRSPKKTSTDKGKEETMFTDDSVESEALDDKAEEQNEGVQAKVVEEEDDSDFEQSKKERKTLKKDAKKSDSKTPKKSDSKTPNKSDSKTPNKSDSKTPKKSDSKTPSKSDSKTPNKSDSKTPNKSDSKTPKKSDSKTPKKSDSKTPKKSDSKTPKKSDSKTPKKSDSKTPNKSDIMQDLEVLPEQPGSHKKKSEKENTTPQKTNEEANNVPSKKSPQKQDNEALEPHGGDRKKSPKEKTTPGSKTTPNKHIDMDIYTFEGSEDIDDEEQARSSKLSKNRTPLKNKNASDVVPSSSSKKNVKSSAGKEDDGVCIVETDSDSDVVLIPNIEKHLKPAQETRQETPNKSPQRSPKKKTPKGKAADNVKSPKVTSKNDVEAMKALEQDKDKKRASGDEDKASPKKAKRTLRTRTKPEAVDDSGMDSDASVSMRTRRSLGAKGAIPAKGPSAAKKGTSDTDQSDVESKPTRRSVGGRRTLIKDKPIIEETISETEDKSDVETKPGNKFVGKLKPAGTEPKTPETKSSARRLSASTSKKAAEKKVEKLRGTRKRRLSSELSEANSTDSEVSFPKSKKVGIA